MSRMKLTQTLPAVVVSGLLAATWAVPALASRMVTTPVTTISADESKTLETALGGKVTFEAPQGWTTTPLKDPSEVVYSNADHERELKVMVVGGSEDFDATADRVLRNQALAGTSGAFDGSSLTLPEGFTGKACEAVKPAAGTTGRCAVLHQGPTVVAVIATGAGIDVAPDLQALLDSLVLTAQEEETE